MCSPLLDVMMPPLLSHGALEHHWLLGYFIGILWIHFFITITVPTNTVTVMDTDINLYKTYTVLQDITILLVPVTKREAIVQNLIHDLLNYNTRGHQDQKKRSGVNFFAKGVPRWTN